MQLGNNFFSYMLQPFSFGVKIKSSSMEVVEIAR